MAIWQVPFTLEQLHERSLGTMSDLLGIRFAGFGDDWITATMPVDHRTKQPMGILHGGASVVLAETLGSLAANLCIDPLRYGCVGQEINANHLRPVSAGIVTATARPIHLGKRSHVWQIEIRDERERLACISRLTMAVVERTTGDRSLL